MRQSKSQHITFDEPTEEDNKLGYSEERTEGRPGEADSSHDPENYCANDNIQHWLGDIFFVHGDAYLIGTMLPVDMPLVTHLDSRKTEAIRKGLRSQLAEITAQEFEVSTLLFDGEGGIAALETEMKEAGYELNTAGPKQHVPEVERKIGSLKGRLRSIHYSTLWNLPYTLLRYEVKYAKLMLSITPHHGRADTTSPYELFYGRKVDFKRQLRLSFGDYAEVYNNQTTASNTLEERAVSCIALLPLLNKQGTYLFFSLKSRSVIKGDKWKALPTPQWVIDRMNTLARNQKRHLPKDPVFRRSEAADDEPHMDDAELLQPLEEAEDPWDDAHEGPNDRDDWEEAHPAEEDQYGHADGTGDDDIDPETQYPAPLLDDIYENKDDVIEDHTHNYGTRAAHGISKTNLVPQKFREDNVYHAAATEFSALTLTTESDDQPENIIYALKATNHTVKSALAAHQDDAFDAITRELRTMLNLPTFEAVDTTTLTAEELKKRIPSKMFIKLKYLADGDFEKIKARLVAGGHRQDRSLYTEEQTSSPTAGTPTVFTVAGLAAREERKVRVADVGTAYLKAFMEGTVYMILDPTLSALICVMKPEWDSLLDGKGRLTVKLLRALYGCIESGKLWHDTLSKFLLSLGFLPNPHDICTFNKWCDEEDVQLTVCIFVDDFMLTCVSDRQLDIFMAQLRERFGDVTERTGPTHNYLGMVFDFSTAGQCSVTMPGYVEVMLTKYEVKLTQKYPTNGGLFVRDDNAPPLVETLRAEFHSRVYAVAYMVQRIKPECLPIVSELCSCVRTATVEDWYKLEHLLQYINGTKDIGITIRIPRGPLFVNASVDSSHGCHPNMRGHGGGTISISRDGSGGTIHSESSKLSLNTKSTAETELVTASDYGSQALFIGGFLREQGYENVTIILEQDNESTIALMRKGRSTAQATRHIAIRYFWLHDRLKRGDLEIIHVPGTEIRADLLTKDIRGAAFFTGRMKLNNWNRK